MAHLHILKQKAQTLNTEVYALYLSYRDTNVKWYVKVILAFVIGYGISPIDFIPDFKAVFGFLDDIIIIAAGLSTSYHLVSKQVLDKARIRAYEEFGGESQEAVMAFRIVLYAWVLAVSLVAVFFYKLIYMNAM
ncbi:YkvA family protein [Pontibacter sp. SGAir0037]|uniref:YkvA family protein n=1 Tax=Pontibacter sp. SGAir0037 TaxID=2571030 RepID=UPI0010CCC8A3|nr:YkvA family protein [Pontibacter sp. SGAir0037]QCR23630.1 DUF1232 domain-containing protein [Pontibacter sp. SGAir0037]